MPEFTCPLCGHLPSIRYYDPEDLPLDIEGVTKVGLGLGRGTKVIDRFSLLCDNDVSSKIVRRVLSLRARPITISLKDYNKIREDAEALKVQQMMREKEATRSTLERIIFKRN